LLGVQILHAHFVATNVPALAQARADALGWVV
jgi:asparagine synthase (glutamine-hydrolysing)